MRSGGGWTQRSDSEWFAGLLKNEPVYHDFRAGDVRHFLADIGKGRQLLGYTPEFSVRTGLDKAADWYMDRFLG